MSQPLIIGAVSLAVIDTTIVDLKGSTSKSPTFKIVLGGFIVMVVLLALSDSQEELADSLALLILLATLVGPKGGALSDLLTKLTAGQIDPTKTGQTVAQAAIKGQNIASSQTVKQS